MQRGSFRIRAVPMNPDEEKKKVEDGSEVDEYAGFNFRAIGYGCLSAALADLNYSMLVSFFPEAAQKRSLNSVSIGILFSVFQIANLITCFFVPKVNRKYGGVRVLAMANLGQALATTTFAVTGLFHEHDSFFAMCMVLRMLQGSLAAFSEISAAGIVMRAVPSERAGEAVLYIEFVRIFGEMSGPLVGGTLYAAFGYTGPFLVSGATIGVLAIFMLFIYPMDASVDNQSHDEAQDEENGRIVKAYTKLPTVMALFAAVVTVSSAFTFLEPTLQPFLSKDPYNFSSTMVGVVFTISTFVFFIVSDIAEPFVTWLGSIRSLLLGFAITGMSFFFIAPPLQYDHTPLTWFSFVHPTEHLPATLLLIASMSAVWFGGSLAFIPVNVLLVEEGKRHGYTVNSISDAIGMILNIAFTSGASVGPFLGGLWTHQYGFARSNCMFAYTILFLAAIIGTILTYTFQNRPPLPTDDDNKNDDNEQATLVQKPADYGTLV